MVENHWQTVAFIEATDYLKEVNDIEFKEIGEMIGLPWTKMSMVRAKRRKVKDREIDKLVKMYPETSQFFQDAVKVSDQPAPTYGKMIENTLHSKDAALEAQKKTIAMQEEMIRILKDEIEALRQEIDRKLK